MNLSADEQIRRTLDSLAERLRTSIADELNIVASQIAGATEASAREASERAARESAATTEREVLARLNAEFTRREEQLKESVRAQWFDVGLQQGRTEGAASQAAREAEARAALAAAEQAAAARIAAAEHSANDLRQTTMRLHDAVQALDGSSSLSQTLEALANAARLEADRSAILLVKGDTLRPWSQTGFDSLAAASNGVPLLQAGVIADTIDTGGARQVPAHADGTPAFARDAGNTPHATFTAVPLRMNGQVIAVLCGHQQDPPDGGAVLLAVFDILARHAARVLESLTALRLAQLGSHGSAAAASQAPGFHQA